MENHELNEIAAEVAHAANRAYCRATGDHSQVAWEDAPEWQRASCRAGVRAIATGEVAQRRKDAIFLSVVRAVLFPHARGAG